MKAVHLYGQLGPSLTSRLGPFYGTVEKAGYRFMLTLLVASCSNLVVVRWYLFIRISLVYRFTEQNAHTALVRATPT